MSKSIIINLGSGDLSQGFPRVTVQLWMEDNRRAEQFIGKLPAAPNLRDIYRNWQISYRDLCDSIIEKQLNTMTGHSSYRGHLIAKGGMELSRKRPCNTSQRDFDDLCEQLQTTINSFLKSEEFSPIEYQLRSRLNPFDFIRVIFETNDLELQRLPWHRWLFFQDYPKAEMALSQAEYQYFSVQPLPKTVQKVRILAVLQDSLGIDSETEALLLQGVQDAEVDFLVNPSRQKLNMQLWRPEGWDILFFAGHSQTQGDTGHLYINNDITHNSVTISHLEEALKTAIERGLKLAIFNSCDGLGLAQSLEKLHIPTVMVMREPVSNRVAQQFFQQFLIAYSQEQLPLYLAFQKARRMLQGLENNCPVASWLPVICQNLAVESPTWVQLGGTPPCPYRGLFSFQETDAQFFFGREQVTQQLLVAVKKKSLVALVGASGSGKSSVVFAGLLPRLRHTAYGKGLDTHHESSVQIVSFRPGNNPFKALATALSQCSLMTQVISQTIPKHGQENDSDYAADLSIAVEIERRLRQTDQGLLNLIDGMGKEHLGTRLFLIADQFEELYTLSPESDRKSFLDILLCAVEDAPKFTLILTLRADFCGYILAYRPMSDALQDAIQFLGPMNSEELQAAIEKPAKEMQVELEEGLIQKLIHAMNEQPGRLPLLEFALTQLWSRQRDGQLIHQTYDEIGGVEEALANHAEQVYAQLKPADQSRAQRIFIQLIQPGSGTDDSRRTATKNDVQPENWDLVAHLASSRLVVTNRRELTGEETVEIVHEALIRCWKRLRNWIQVDGEFRLWQEQLRSAMQQWEKSDRDDGSLLRGKFLRDADYWQHCRDEELSSQEKRFIQASLVLFEAEAKKQRRRRQLTISGLTSGLVIASIFAGVALKQWQNSAHNEIKAIQASSEALFASNNKLDALIEAIRARQKSNITGGVEKKTEAQVDAVLRQAVYGVDEYNRLLLHQDEVKSIAFSPDGQMLATASRDKNINLWKKDGSLITSLTGHSDRIWQAVFSPDGQMLASASTDNTVILWTIESGKTPIIQSTLKGHRDGVRGVAFSPDGQMIASASDDQTVKLWTREGRLIQTLEGHTGVVNGVIFSPDGQTIASASDDKTIKLWNRDGTLLTTIQGHADIVNGVAFSPNGEMLASASWDKTVKLWNLQTKEPTLQTTLVGHQEVVFGVEFSPDGQMIASSSWDKTVKLWKRDGRLIKTLIGHSDRVWGMAFSPDGQTLASTSDDKSVKFWKLKSPLLNRLTGHSAVVIGVAFSPDGQTLVSASDDKTVKLWNPDGTLITTFNGHEAQVYGVAFSPDGQTVASASADNTVKLWTIDSTVPQHPITLAGHQSVVWGVAFSPDGKILASASWDGTIKLWSLEQKTPQLLTTLTDHQAAILGVAFSPDGNMLASSSADNTIKLWTLKANQKPLLYKTLTGHTTQVYGVTFSPDGDMIASASADNTIKLWHPNGNLITTLNGHNAVAYSISISPDGETIASASWDKTVKLWDRSGTLLTTLNGYSGRFWGIAFSPDGQTIAAANEDKTVILWNKDNVLTLNPLLYACDWVRDYLVTNSSVSQDDRRICEGHFSQHRS